MLSLRLRGFRRLRFRWVFRVISLAITWLILVVCYMFWIVFFHPKERLILYLTSSSLGTRIVGYSNEPAALLPVFGWPFVHLIPYLVLVAFSHIFSVGPPHMGHLKSFMYFHLKPRKSQEWISRRCVFPIFFSPLALCWLVCLSLTTKEKELRLLLFNFRYELLNQF